MKSVVPSNFAENRKTKEWAETEATKYENNEE